VFALAMGINIRRGRDRIDCGCGETFLRQTLSWTLVMRNGLLAVMLTPPLAMTARMSMPLALTGVVAGAALFLLYLLFNILAALPPAVSRGHRFA
ncbi:MAG TPA: MauE/DoxX family redox-associated membrane protein, partial [Rhizomicrobium sp.]|jgi:hypothetical protein|nr:MauE/DoxX family redox-associated membrane protein [Rhizomicrobium sp.]